jgi:hypothetical protein
MIIELKEITVGELLYGYIDNNEEGIKGYCRKLNICPLYRREFIYEDKQRDAVIGIIKKDFSIIG